MIPDVEERSHIERFVGSGLIVKSHGYGKQQSNYRQYQNTRYPKYVNDGGTKNENRNTEHTRYPFTPKTTGLYRNADSRANCWSGYPLISFNAGRRDNPSPDQPRHYYTNNTLKSYGNTKPTKCSYSDFVTNKQGVPLIQAKFQEKQNWERENRNFHTKINTEPSYKPVDGRENRKNECTTDENFANSENCLPRIIKPRKRRKKDRKPNTTFTATSNVQTQTTKKLQEKNEKSVYKIHQHDKSSPDSSQMLHNVLSLYRPSKLKPLALYQDGNVNDLLISRSLVNLFSEDSPQLLLTDDLRFDNFLAKDTTDSPTTFCNCRYCDPEGVVWDIRQRCFSPNLMPPVDGVGTLKLAKNKDWSTTLKRSCSEPASKPSSTPVVSRVRALSDSYDTTNQNIQVSSEIVTSLNGHRDIEIKFFSSSTPTTKV